MSAQADQLFKDAVHFQLDNNRLGYLNELFSKGIIIKQTYDDSLEIPHYASPIDSENEEIHKVIDQILEQPEGHSFLLPVFLHTAYDHEAPNYTSLSKYKDAYDATRAQLRSLVHQAFGQKKKILTF